MLKHVALVPVVACLIITGHRECQWGCCSRLYNHSFKGLSCEFVPQLDMNCFCRESVCPLVTPHRGRGTRTRIWNTGFWQKCSSVVPSQNSWFGTKRLPDFRCEQKQIIHFTDADLPGKGLMVNISDNYSKELRSSQTKPARTAKCSCLEYRSLFFCQLCHGEKVASASGALVEAKPITVSTVAVINAFNKCFHRHFSCTCKVLRAI